MTEGEKAISISSGASFQHISHYPRHDCPSVAIGGSGFFLFYVKCILPPMRKRSPATYCIRSCSLQQPSMPMIQPNRMMEMAMPMKLAVILWRSARARGGGQVQARYNSPDCQRMRGWGEVRVGVVMVRLRGKNK